jgi:hypothetical protein
MNWQRGEKVVRIAERGSPEPPRSRLCVSVRLRPWRVLPLCFPVIGNFQYFGFMNENGAHAWRPASMWTLPSIPLSCLMMRIV